MAAYGSGQYKRASATTASPGELVVMLYDGVLRFCNMTLQALEREDIPAIGVGVGKALAIIDYLQTILNPEPFPELVAQLDGLYTFWMKQLTQVNLTRNPELLRAIVPQIQGLRDAWHSAQGQVSTKSMLDRLGQ